MNPPTNLTLLLLTKNESTQVKSNLNWIGECPNITELIVIDDNSTDDTIKIIKSLKFSKHLNFKIFTHPLNNNFSAQRQFGVDKSTNDWILWLDADEIPTPQLITFLKSFTPTTTQPFSFPRQDTFYGHDLKHGENGQIRFLRLFHKNHGQFKGAVHETWQSPQPPITTNFPILHHPHPTLKSLFEKINFYTDLRAKELFDQKVTTNTLAIIFYPLAKLITNYFFKLGFLDGTPGIIMALAMSFHSFLVRAKLWHLWHP